ncbi:MAG: hypothetical protein VX089_03070 [Pseudomonadota bacterium]|nr:hypothetical protein [Pseudomonadota bacterium]
MIKNFFILITIFFLLVNCTKKNTLRNEISNFDYKTFTLDIYDYNFLIQEKAYNLTEDLGFDTSFMLDKLYNWGNKKFKVNGENKSLLLAIEKLELEKKKIKRNTGLKKIFFSEEDIEYKLTLKVSLKFFDDYKRLETLNVNGNISFLIQDNFSIIQRKSSLSSAYEELMIKIDAAINKEFKKEVFFKFRSS